MANQKEIQVKYLNHSGTNTIKVELEKKILHFKYKKYIKKTFKYLVHFDSNVELYKGDKIKISKTRRISKTKSFRFVSKINSVKDKV